MKLSLEENTILGEARYDFAKIYWEAGIKDTYASKKTESGKITYNFNSMRLGLKKSISILIGLHRDRLVETIDGLPKPDEIDTMDDLGLMKLNFFFRTQLFPGFTSRRFNRGIKMTDFSEDEKNFEYDEIRGAYGRKPKMAILNKTKLSKYELDDLFTSEETASTDEAEAE